MAASFQQQSRRRKIIYTVLILLLFSLTLLHRQVVEANADKYNLLETNLGDVDLGHSAARYALASLRGPLICWFWNEAEERKIRHEWHQLAIIYKTLAKLQPHFKSPWEYQGWNLAYNISVEFDDIQDKYFYVGEGVNWLAEGERMNRMFESIPDPANPGRIIKKEVGDPDQREYIGHVIQNKMTVSDENKTFRCFLHLSCIPPDVWDAAKLRQNPQLLEAFKQQYKQLTRRIRELERISEDNAEQTNRAVLNFLQAHRGIISIYPSRDQTARQVDFKPFPIWPRPIQSPETEPNQDPFEIALHWFNFSMEVVPPLQPFLSKDDTVQVADAGRQYRRPKGKSFLIFYSRPAQTKALQATDLAQNGWFPESQEAWEQAYQMFLLYGKETGLEAARELRGKLDQQASLFRTKFPESVQAGGPPPRYGQTPEIMESYRAHVLLGALDNNLYVSHYPHWRNVSEVNRLPKATQARQHIYRALHDLRSDLTMARAEFERGLAILKELMARPRLPDPQQRDLVSLLVLGSPEALPAARMLQTEAIAEMTPFGRDDQVQDEVAELHERYLRLRARCEAALWLRGLLVADSTILLGRQAITPGLEVALVSCLPASVALTTMEDVEDALESIPGPLDDILTSAAKRTARSRLRDQ